MIKTYRIFDREMDREVTWDGNQISVGSVEYASSWYSLEEAEWLVYALKTLIKTIAEGDDETKDSNEQ